MTDANELVSPSISANGYPVKIGLTKREYFAAMAMQGIVSNQGMIDTDSWTWLAENSVKAADALINVLNQSK